MNAFEKAVSDAGFSGLTHAAIAHRLSVGVPYVQQLLRGEKPISAPIRAKLDALIAAKANGPEPVEQFEVDLPAEISSATQFENDEIYHVSGNADGGWNVVEKVWVVHHSIVAKVPSTAGEDNAKRIAELLNKEGG